ncbi:cupin domain-containing protein [Ottowia sp.]|uniref:(R)-mandelonitrile lyase n=1 Tax=Ottowia sp. TaxID=1898956 RepID=UPI003A84F2A6
MKKQLVAVAAATALLGAAAVHAQGIQIAPAGSTPSRLGGSQNFVGHVTVDMAQVGQSGQHGSVGMVDFAPGARTAWHVHPVGQLLIVTDGKGWVQEQGQPRREIKAGDVVWIDADVKHWHGAASANGMRHWAVAYKKDGQSSNWKEQVSDDQYQGR